MKEEYLFKDLELDTDILKVCLYCNKYIYKNQYRYNKMSWSEIKYCSQDCCDDNIANRTLKTNS